MMGIKPCIAKEGLKQITCIDGRFELIKDKVTVILDYAHTEAAVANILKSINSIKIPGQKTFCIFGCGGERDRSKRPLIGATAEKYSDEVIITNDNPRGENEMQIISDIVSGMTLPQKRKIIPTRHEAINHAISQSRDGDIIIILGKSHERYTVDKSGYHSYNEKQIVLSALKKRRNEKAVTQ